jgi:hypothetical protein
MHDLGADYMGRVVPLCRVVPAKRVDFWIAITCMHRANPASRAEIAH